MCGRLSAVASLVAGHWLQGVRAQELWCPGSVAPRHVESSWTRDQPMSPALADGFLIIGPPGKSNIDFYFQQYGGLYVQRNTPDIKQLEMLDKR